MSYAAAERSVIDIDEFERRLRGPAPRPTADPLAELARLVTPAAAKPEALDAIFARSRPQDEQVAVVEDAPPAFDVADLRGSVAADHAFPADSFDNVFDGAAAPRDHFADAPEAGEDWALRADDRSAAETAAPRSRRPLYATAAVIAVGLLGIGGTFAFKGRHAASGELVEVKAPAGPTKVQAQVAASESASASVNSTVLDRGGVQTPVTRVIDRQEKPVDLKEVARAPRVVSLSPTGSTQLTSSAEQGSVFAEPRKVKTVSVRPDGSIVGSPKVDAAPVAAQPPAPQASAPSAPAAAAPAKTATPKTVARVATTPKPPVDATETATKPPAAKPAAAKPANTRVANAETDGAHSSAAPHAASAGGGFSVQLAAPGNEAEARSIASKLGQKFSGELNGSRVTVQKASDKSVYRVRTAGMSREAAVAACERIKASGGVCFVAKN